MARATTTDRRWSGWVSLLVASAAVITGVLLGGTHLLLPDKKSKTSPSILMIFAKEAFDWSSSTTPAPLSATAVAVKAILGGKSDGALALGLENAVLSAAGPDGSTRAVDVKVDPEFGTTPLHLAELWGSSELVEYLLSIGASPDAFDTVGRQPRNMTFKAFSANSKKAADARLPALPDSASAAAGDRGMPQDDEMRCEIPEVTIPLFPTADGDDAAELHDHDQWQSSALAALAEVRRLVSEGEPVMVRNVVPWLQQQEKKQLQFPDAASFAEAWGHRPVDVGGVPYAKNFDLLNERTTLSDYMKSTKTTAAAAADSSGRGNDQKATGPAPNYVFQVDTEACAEGRDLLGRVVDAALPSSGDRPIVCPPPGGLRGLESVHYYLGGRHSGAPFHIHSDALNLAVSGRKRWWVVTPREAVWSRRHIRDYAEEGKGGPPASGEDRPMECVQRGGDLVYVPGDWGHAAMNLEDGTFGYTLELVNRRDTLASVLGMGCEQ
ncbi:similar to RIKEN cDNA 2610003J06 [Ectocarpus siliculosus]|uniref:JmjC domain-containing protein n=1 Tax=Ectocarpus siliculosus TaxID=2880 RepID=D7FH28_ECTSI|nr:similar to RIKEN cDNA 2610003J06 [Ectocarpus siliculosus]|eukprot:CBJ28406.1 similar to RIKEN cDNA 2610003J06 [Ectocarpus siliculosus]